MACCGEGNRREETFTNLRSDSMARVKYPIRTGPATESPKLSYSLRRLVPNSGKYIVLADDDRHEEVTDRQLLIVIIFIAVV